jgi:WD40 repeat protein
MERTSFAPKLKYFSHKMICSCESFILLSLVIVGLVKFNLNTSSQRNANVITPNHETININGLRVYSVAISPNEKTIVNGNLNKDIDVWDLPIKLWNVENGNLINTLNGHEKAVWSLAFSPNQQILISGSADSTIKLWPLASAITNIKSSFSSQTDNFRQAINVAINAANLTQTATSLQEWQQVVNHWQKAIKLMQTISVSSIHYPVAQQKMIEYRRNLNYAQRNILVSHK